MNQREKFNFYTATILLSCLIITPIPIYGRRTLNAWIDFLFTSPTRWLRQNFFPSYQDFDGFFTDSLNYLILLAIAFLLGLLLAFLLEKFAPQLRKYLNALCNLALVYYLAWVFLVYGFSKISGHQFPKISLSNFENARENQDLLFWAWVGSHPHLVLALGWFEISIGLALFYPKSRKIGLSAYTLSLVVIITINAYFGIGVIAFSILLLLAAIHIFFNLREPPSAAQFLEKPLAKSMHLFLILALITLAFFHQKH